LTKRSTPTANEALEEEVFDPTPAIIVAGAMGLLVLSAVVVLVWLGRSTRSQDVPRAVVEPSPLPWIADSAWSQLITRRGRRWGLGSDPLVIAPRITLVTEDDLERVPEAPVPAGVSVPDTGQPRDHQLTLLQTPGGGLIRSPIWPICCERLACLISAQGGRESLVGIESFAGPLDRAFLSREFDSWGGPGADREAFRRAGWTDILQSIRDGDHSGQAINIFQCRSCGRIYVASCSP